MNDWLGKILLLVLLLSLLQTVKNTGEDFALELVEKIYENKSYNCIEAHERPGGYVVSVGGSRYLINYFVEYNENTKKYEITGQKNDYQYWYNIIKVQHGYGDYLATIVYHYKYRRYYACSYVYRDTLSGYFFRCRAYSTIQPNISAFSIGNSDYAAVAAGTLVETLRFPWMDQQKQYPCINRTNYNLTKTNFGCGSVAVYISGSNAYLILGLYTLPTKTHASGKITSGIIVKRIRTNNRTYVAENLWHLCSSDDCSDSGFSQINTVNYVLSGNQNYIYSVFQSTTFDVIPDGDTDYTVTQVTSLEKTAPQCEGVAPPPPADGEDPEGGYSLYDGEDGETRYCAPTPEEIQVLEEIDGYKDGYYWTETDTEFVLYRKQTFTIDLYIPIVGKNTIKVYKGFHTNLSTGKPSVFGSVEYYDPDPNVDVTIKDLSYIDMGCTYQHLVIIQPQDATLYLVYDVDMPYIKYHNMDGRQTIQQQFDALDEKPYINTEFSFIVDTRHINGFDSGDIEYDIQNKPAWLEFDNETLEITGEPQTADFLQEDEMTVVITNTASQKTFCAPFTVTVFNKPPTIITPLQTQIKESIGSFVTESLTEFKSALVNYEDHEGASLSVTRISLIQIDKSTAFKDETLLGSPPSWMTITETPGTDQIIITAEPPQQASKFEYRVTYEIDDGVDQVYDVFIIKISSFKNPFLGIEFSTSQFSRNEKAIKIDWFFLDDEYYIMTFIQDVGIQANRVINNRVLEEVGVYFITDKVQDIFLYKQNGENFYMLFSVIGEGDVKIVDVTDPSNMVEHFVFSGYTNIHKLKYLPTTETIDGNSVVRDYFAVFDEVGIYIGDFYHVGEELVNSNLYSYAQTEFAEASDFLKIEVKTRTFYCIAKEQTLAFYEGGSNSYDALVYKFLFEHDFVIKQMVSFTSSKATYLATSTVEHGIKIFSLDEKLFDPLYSYYSTCPNVFSRNDSSSHSAVSSDCYDNWYRYYESYYSSFYMKNIFDMYLYQDSTTRMLVVCDGYLGVKLISVNFPKSPKQVTQYTTFDSQASTYFWYDNELYLAVADERQGSKMLQLIKGSDDKPFYSYAQDISQKNDMSYIEQVMILKVSGKVMALAWDGQYNLYLYNAENVSTPEYIKQFNFPSKIKFIEVQKFQDIIYILTLLESGEFRIDRINYVYNSDTSEYEYLMVQYIFYDREIPIPPPPEGHVPQEGDPPPDHVQIFTITGQKAFRSYYYNKSNFMIAISNGSKLKLYEVSYKSTEQFYLDVRHEDTTITGIKKMYIEIVKGLTIMFFYNPDTKIANLFEITGLSSYSAVVDFELGDELYKPIYYEQKQTDPEDETVVLKHNQVLAILDGYSGIKLYDVTDLATPILLQKVNSYNTRFGKLLDFGASGIFIAYTDDIKGFRLLQMNMDIEDNTPQQRVVYYTEGGPTNHIETKDEKGRIYAVVSDGYSGMKVIELSSDLGLFPKLGVIVDNEKKQYSLKFYPVYKSTLSAYLYNTQLLSIKVTEASRKILNSMPYWATTNLISKTIQLVPPEQDSLKQTQFVYYKFSIEINIETLMEELDGTYSEIIELLELLQQYGYVTSTDYYFLTNNYDPSKDMMLPQVIFEPSKVFSSLKYFLYEGFTELATSDYAKLNFGPELINPGQNEIQEEFEKKIGNPIKVGQSFIFEFFNVFIDYDNDPIRYDVAETKIFESKSEYDRYVEQQANQRRQLQAVQYDTIQKLEYIPWIDFNTNEMLFSGEPTADTLDKVYEFLIEADDGYTPSYITLTMDMTDGAPYLAAEPALLLQNQYNTLFSNNLPHPYKYFFFEINIGAFQDPEGDQLQFEVEVQVCKPDYIDTVNDLLVLSDYETIKTTEGYWESTIYQINPFVEYWLEFDSVAFQLMGTPSVDEIGIYKVKFTASDLNKSVEDIFIMTVTNETPTLTTNDLFRLQSQYNSMVQIKENPHPFNLFKFLINFDLFEDVENDQLRYEVDVQIHDPSQLDTIKTKFDNEEFDELRTNDVYWDSNVIRLSPTVDYWMIFDKQFGELYGTPALSNLGYLRIKLTAEDMTGTIDDNFVMSITNAAPTLTDDGSIHFQNQYNTLVSNEQIPHPYDKFEMQLQFDLFEDLEGDELAYNVYVSEIKPESLEYFTDQYQQGFYDALADDDDIWSPVIFHLTPYEEYWLKFDPEYLKLYGVPLVENIGAFRVTITGEDMNSLISDKFVMTVENQGPELSDQLSLRLQNQYNYFVDMNAKPHPYRKLNFILQTSLYKDFEQDTLSYSVEVWLGIPEQEEMIASLFENQEYQTLKDTEQYWDSRSIILSSFEEFWLKFDGKTELFGIPALSDLGYLKIEITATDYTKSVSDSFVMSVTNDIPVLSSDETLKLQSQFLNTVNTKGQPHPTHIFRMELQLHLFQDAENDPLQYIVRVKKHDPTQINVIKEYYDQEAYQQLSDNDSLWSITYIELSNFQDYWLKYDPSTGVLTGTPAVEDLGYLRIEFIVSDLTGTINDSFVMSITNVEPILTTFSDLRLQEQYNDALNVIDYPHPHRNFRYQFDMGVFVDHEDDPLDVFVEAQVQTTDENLLPEIVAAYEQNNFDLLRSNDDYWVQQKTPLYAFVPYWLKFDSEFNEFSGIPEIGDYKFFRITVTASDMTGSVTDNFVIKVINEAPIINRAVTHEIPKGRVNSNYEYQFDENTFKDTENDNLTYKVKSMPEWLEFNPNLRTIKGTPPIKGQYSIAIEGIDIVNESTVYTFTIDIGISWFELIMIIVGMLTPFASVLTLLKHKQQIFAVLCKKKYQYMRYDLAPVNQVYVKQIPLIRLELTEVKTHYKNFKKRAIQEMKLKHGKKNKIWKEWIEQNYYDEELGQFKSEQIIEDMIKVSKETNQNSILNNLNQCAKPTQTHFYIMLKAQLARELLKKDYQGWKVYQAMKKSLKTVPVFHFDDKGRKTRSLKSYRDWYKPLISKVNYDYMAQDYNMFPDYEINEALVESVLRDQHQTLLQKLVKNKKIVPLSEERIVKLQKLIQENIIAEVNGVLTEYLGPLKGPAHGNSLLIRPQHIKSLEALIRLDTYNSGNKLVAKLHFFKLDYVPLAGSENDILPEWLNFTINNGVLEFQGIPPVDYLGRHLMIRIKNNADFIIEEFFIKFSDDVQETEDVEKQHIGQKKRVKFMEIQEEEHYKPDFENAQLYSNTQQQQAQKYKLISQQPSTRYLASQMDAALFAQMKKQSVQKLKRNYEKLSIKTQELRRKFNIKNNKFNIQEITLYSIEQQQNYTATFGDKLKVELFDLRQRSVRLLDFDMIYLYKNITHILEMDEPHQSIQDCMKAFGAIIFNNFDVLQMNEWNHIKQQLKKIDEDTDYTVKEYREITDQKIINYIKNNYTQQSWFQLDEPDAIFTAQTIIYNKWLQILILFYIIQDKQALLDIQDGIISRAKYGRSQKPTVQQEISLLFKDKESVEKQLLESEKKQKTIEQTIKNKLKGDDEDEEEEDDDGVEGQQQQKNEEQDLQQNQQQTQRSPVQEITRPDDTQCEINQKIERYPSFSRPSSRKSKFNLEINSQHSEQQQQSLIQTRQIQIKPKNSITLSDKERVIKIEKTQESMSDIQLPSVQNIGSEQKLKNSNDQLPEDEEPQKNSEKIEIVPYSLDQEEELVLNTENINKKFNISGHSRFIKVGNNLEYKLEYDENMLKDFLIISCYRDQVLLINQNNEIFVNHKLIQEKRQIMDKKSTNFVKTYDKFLDFNKLVEQQLDLENFFNIKNLSCQEGYPSIQKKWNLFFYILANIFQAQVQLKVPAQKQKEEDPDEYYDFTFEPYISKDQLDAEDKYKLAQDIQIDTLQFNFKGKLDSGYFYIILQDFFKEGQEINIGSNSDISSDKLFFNYIL